MFNVEFLVFSIAAFLAMNMGGSGISPSFSAAYGANILHKGLIPGLFGIFVFLGAATLGSNVVKTLSKGLIPSESITIPVVIIILSACTVAMVAANWLKIPQSTSQATVGAIAGVGLFMDSLNYSTLGTIVPKWFVHPLTSFFLTLIVYWISRQIKYKYYPEVDWNNLNKHSAIRWFVIITSCYVAFSIGANNVANVSGPLVGAGLITTIIGVFMIAPFFGIGSSLIGERTIHTTGKEITDINYMNASLISLVTGSLLIYASYLGLPQSIVQLNAASIIAVAIFKPGFQKNTVKKALTVWVIAPIISLLASFILCKIFIQV